MDHAMDDAMEDGMDGTMNAMDGEGMDGEGMDEMEDQEPVEEVFDVTKCPSKSLPHSDLIFNRMPIYERKIHLTACKLRRS